MYDQINEISFIKKYFNLFNSFVNSDIIEAEIKKILMKKPLELNMAMNLKMLELIF